LLDICALVLILQRPTTKAVDPELYEPYRL
jgi:hypothetical protein